MALYALYGWMAGWRFTLRLLRHSKNSQNHKEILCLFLMRCVEVVEVLGISLIEMVMKGKGSEQQL